MSLTLVAIALLGTVLAIPHVHIKTMNQQDCVVGQLFTQPHEEGFVRMCKVYEGFKYSRIVGCRSADGDLVKFGETYDHLKSPYTGYRYQCTQNGTSYHYDITHCIIGMNRQAVLPGQQVVGVAGNNLCQCHANSITCDPLP